MAITLKTRTGEAIEAVIPALAALRCEVFRAFPYLYDGDEAYERRYLQTYVRSPKAAVIVAMDDEMVVGASTCLPLTDETQDVQAPFKETGIDPASVFYFGESVLPVAYRGQGLGVAFFTAREAHAIAVSHCDFAAFASVVRPADHPARPAGWQPLDEFWRRRGFVRRPDLLCHMSWKEIGQGEETEKPLMFWLKSLTGVPLP
jgi:GNAT superfamily N-acetyltransferase